MLYLHLCFCMQAVVNGSIYLQTDYLLQKLFFLISDCWVMQTFPIRLIPWFFLLKAAVILAYWGWNKLGTQDLKGFQSLLQAQTCTTTWSCYMLIALALPCAAGQQVLVTSVDCCLLSAEHSSAQISFLAAAHSVDLVVVFPQIQQSFPSADNGQLIPGVTVKGLKDGMLKVGVEQRELLESLLSCENKVMKWNRRKFLTLNTYSLVSTAATHTVLQKFPEMES